MNLAITSNVILGHLRTEAPDDYGAVYNVLLILEFRKFELDSGVRTRYSS